MVRSPGVSYKEESQQYTTYYVTLRQFQAETETVLIPNLLENYEVKENKIYEFEFKLINDSIK